MDKQVKKMWVEALRSGEYKQTRRRLKRGNSFCCLGVLREIAPQEYRRVPADRNGGLNHKVRKWAGLESDDPHIESRSVSLAYLNDAGYCFEKIADLIEKEL